MQWQSVIEAERTEHDGAEAGRQLILTLRREITALQTELDQLEPVIGAAVLTATAFRLRDQEGLVLALRGLVRSLTHLHRTAEPRILADHQPEV
jgi:hypothetical protein